MRQNWLLVERPENWDTDCRNSFRYFGLSDKKIKQASRIKAGDWLFFYVAGKSCISDIHMSTANGVRPLKMGGDYLDSFPIRVDTRPILTLTKERWVPFYTLTPLLSFTKDLTDTRQLFRNSLRLLSSDDANIIELALREAANVT